MGDFVFNLSSNLIVGTDILISLGDYVSKYGTRFMLILDPTFKDVDLLVRVKESLEQKSLRLFSFDGIKKSPDTDTVLRCLKLASAAHVDGVIVLGGIVTCSIAKAVASLYNEKNTIYSYLEGQPITEKPLPLIQIPTVCNNPFIFTNTLYLTDSRRRTVSALKCYDDVASLVLFDSSVYKKLSLNALRLAIFSGLSLAVDAYISRRANFFSDALLKKAISLFVLALNQDHDKIIGQSIEETLTQAGILSAMAFKSSSVGLAAAVSIVANGKYNASVSSVLAIMLIAVLQDAVSSNLFKVSEIAFLFLEGKKTDVSNENLEEFSLKGIEALKEKMLGLELPTKMSNLNLALEDMTSVAEEILTLDFINYIPRLLTSLDALEIIKRLY